MPDGQEKSDDLIAELARLMASGASAPEPEAKPGPKLVSVPEPSPTPAPVRVPGAAPVAAEPARPATPPAEPPRAAPVIRIPGMDQPVPSSRAPEPVPAAPQPTPAGDVPRPSAVDLGPAPTAAPIQQEPLVTFRMPEPPKPAASAATSPAPSNSGGPDLRPGYSAAPVPPVSAVKSGPEAPVPAQAATVDADAPKPTAPPSAAPAVAPAAEGLPVTNARPQPAGDAFDFNFGFKDDQPEPDARSAEPATARSNPPAAAPAVAAPPRQSSGDLIADLIAAELDLAELGGPVPAAAVSPPPSRPVATSAPAVAMPAPSMPRANPVAPSFGAAVASVRPAASAPRPAAAPTPAVDVERDPIDEIESLIGEAVRIELGNDRPAAAPASAPSQAPDVAAPRVEPRASAPVPPPPAQAAPVVPPLTTGFAPRRAALKDNEINISSAEAAIRAAAAAADSELRPDAAEAPMKRPRARRERRGLMAGGVRQYVGMAVAGTLLLAAGFGLYWVLGMGGGTDGDVPVLQADTTPAKQAAPATPAETDTQGNVVFSEIDGSSTAEGEQLVSRDDSADTPIADVARTVGDDGAGVSEGELANRKVRTVTVRPDGTIVSGDEAVAGNEALPVDRPNVPDLPGADVQPSELLATLPTNDAAPTSTATTPATDATGALAAVAPEDATPPTGEPVVPGSTVTTASGATAPVPMPPPNRQALASRVAAAPAASAAPAAATPVSVSSGGSGSYAQLSSQPTEADARAALSRLQARVSGANLEIRQVDLGARGIWYRVVLPTGSFQEATQVCATIKANGNDCLPING